MAPPPGPPGGARGASGYGPPPAQPAHPPRGSPGGGHGVRRRGGPAGRRRPRHRARPPEPVEGHPPRTPGPRPAARHRHRRPGPRQGPRPVHAERERAGGGPRRHHGRHRRGQRHRTARRPAGDPAARALYTGCGRRPTVPRTARRVRRCDRQRPGRADHRPGHRRPGQRIACLHRPGRRHDRPRPVPARGAGGRGGGRRTPRGARADLEPEEGLHLRLRVGPGSRDPQPLPAHPRRMPRHGDGSTRCPGPSSG